MSTPEITKKELFETYYALPPFRRQASEWVMSQETLDHIQQLPDMGNVPTAPAVLLDRPIRIDPDAEGVTLREADRPKQILGRKLLEALGDAGVIHLGDYVRRVVIDASVDGAAVMYVERYGDERLLKVATALEGIEITSVPAPAVPAESTEPNS